MTKTKAKGTRATKKIAKPKAATETIVKRAKKKETPSASRPPVKICQGLSLVREWMAKNTMTVAQLSRKLDRAWVCADNLVSGKMRPDIDAVFFFEKVGIPIEAWRVET